MLTEEIHNEQISKHQLYLIIWIIFQEYAKNLIQKTFSL